MKAVIHWVKNGHEDCMQIEADDIDALREKASSEMDLRHPDVNSCWSEIIEE